MLFQVYPDCQTLYHRLFLSQSRQALESVRWDLQSQVKVRGGSYNIKQKCQHLLLETEAEALSATLFEFFLDYSIFFYFFILSCLYFISFYVLTILGSTMYMIRLVLRNGIIIVIYFIDCMIFFLQTNKQINFLIQKYLLVNRHIHNVLPSQTLHSIEKVFTPGPLPGVRSGLTARRLLTLQ